MRTHKAYRVAVIDHHQGTVLVRQVADSLQIRYVTIHGENAVCGDEHDFRSGRFCFVKLGFQVLHVIVLIAVTLRFTEAGAVNDGSVVQFIGNDGIFRSQNGFKETAVGIEAGRVEDDIIHTKEVCNFLFQVFVNLLGAADEAYRAEAESPVFVAGFRSFNELRIIGKPQIVVCTHVDNLCCLCSINSGFLRRSDDPFIFPGAAFADFIQCFSVFFQCWFHCIYLLFRMLRISILQRADYFVQSSTTLPDMPRPDTRKRGLSPRNKSEVTDLFFS